ncbi:probable ATP-dependent RNA helicase DDX56 [Sycon ciliatum]|uniref:probable ATP-dependent RNA helicase DDX56 n=1 Tax=Sycon ciliatum TaxID=27933 RepID=UPI0031F6CF9D
MAVAKFEDLGLDDRLLKAVGRLGWSALTDVQAKAIPLALEGKDVLVKARTGSGKTAAYALPVLEKVLQSKKDQTASSQAAHVRALILVPTKELAVQALTNIKDLSSSCTRDVRVADVSSHSTSTTQRTILLEQPDIVIGTPGRMLSCLKSKLIDLQHLSFLVIDEADLVFSFGFEEDVRNVIEYLPNICQSFLVSATLSKDVEKLKEIVLHNPVVVGIEESALPDRSQLSQFHISCLDDDKFLIMYTLLKLRLLLGKSLIFVNGIDRSYRLKLFLEQFGIKTCVLNSELPQNSRQHVVEQFNRGIYDILIASDESTPDSAADKPGKSKKKRARGDKEFGVARGIDFHGVEAVVNFDFPLTADSYVHRVGRTARGMEAGNALSLVSPSETFRLRKAEKKLQVAAGCVAEDAEPFVKPYAFKMSEIEGFRYRANDALRSVTKIAIKEARLKEIRAELLNSEKLKSYFEDNPRDLQILRHDKVLHPVPAPAHLKNVPSYLVPKALEKTFRSSHPHGAKQQRKPVKRGDPFKKGSAVNKRKRDPLRSYKAEKGYGADKRRNNAFFSKDKGRPKAKRKG